MITEIRLFHAISQLLLCSIAFIMTCFDSILLLTTLSSRSDQNIPFSYMIVMSVCGIFGKVAYIIHFATYLILPIKTYYHYRQLLGTEVSFLGTYSYYIIILVSVLMTINRLYVMIRPFDNQAFNRNRISIYSFGIAVFCATILLIPYFSHCPINFSADKLLFGPNCAPDAHPLSTITDHYSCLLVIILLIINTVLVIYLKISSKIQKVSTVASSLVIFQKKRERILMRQAVGVTLFLSIYEVGKFIEQTFPDTFHKLPQYAQDAYFYFRFISVLAINFFVYYVESQTTRKLINKYLKIGATVSTGVVTTTSTSQNNQQQF